MQGQLARLGLVDEEDIVLDEAALSLAALDHDGVDLAPYHEVLASIALRLGEADGAATSAQARADALARVLSDAFGFVGDVDTYDHPDNTDLVRVIDRRRGLPVSLSILYAGAARRIGWAAELLNLPGHVLLLIGGEPGPVIVDPFRGGATVDAARVGALLASSAGPFTRPLLQVAAMSNRAVLVRLLLNQATRAEAAGQGRRALTLYERMTALAPAHGHAWWERARLELVDGDVDAARRSLGAMLEITRGPALRERVTSLLNRLR